MQSFQILILFRGLPGVGKTEIVNQLAPLIDARIVSRDTIRTQVFFPPSFTLQEKAFIDRSVFRCVKLLLERGETVIVDGTAFSKRHAVNKYLQLVYDLDIPVIIIHCRCSDALAEERIRKDIKNKSHPAIDRTVELFRRVKAEFEGIDEPCLNICTEYSVDKNVEKILNVLEEYKRKKA